jgi:hypothetical protein
VLPGPGPGRRGNGFHRREDEVIGSGSGTRASTSWRRNPLPRDPEGDGRTLGGDGEPARWPRSGRSGGRVEESPDSTGQGCWREPGRGDLPVQGNREQTADGGAPGDRRPAQARVKRCGKSAPASGATPAAGNPHPEQGQAWDGRPGRCPQVGRTDGWPPRRRPARGLLDRIRLTSRLTVTRPGQGAEASHPRRGPRPPRPNRRSVPTGRPDPPARRPTAPPRACSRRRRRRSRSVRAARATRS